MTIEELRKIAETERANEKKYAHRVCVCTAAGCLSSGGDHVLDAIKKEVVESGMKNEVLVKGVGCMGLCSAARWLRWKATARCSPTSRRNRRPTW